MFKVITPKMNPEPKRLWVEALRSGTFVQARNDFTDNGLEGKSTHCCLAVLTDIAVQQGVPGVRKVQTDGHDDYEYAVESGSGERLLTGAEVAAAEARDALMWYSHDGDLPPQVVEWAGLTSSNPAIGEASAIERNDGRRESFAMIATAIEEHL
jgi:hypothetical protein